MYYIGFGLIQSTLMSGTKEIITSVISAINIPQRGMNALSKLLSPALTESGEYIADIFREKRELRQIDAAKRIEQKALSKNIPLKALPEKLIYPAMHYISIEDEEDIKIKWVNLLTNALQDPNLDLYNSYTDILSKLSTNEVKILDYLKYQIDNKLKEEVFGKYFEKYKLENELNLSIDILDVFLDNLVRLNLIEYISMPSSGGPIKNLNLLMSRPSKFRLTALGNGFVNSVKD